MSFKKKTVSYNSETFRVSTSFLIKLSAYYDDLVEIFRLYHSIGKCSTPFSNSICFQWKFCGIMNCRISEWTSTGWLLSLNSYFRLLKERQKSNFQLSPIMFQSLVYIKDTRSLVFILTSYLDERLHASEIARLFWYLRINSRGDCHAVKLERRFCKEYGK